MQKSKEKLYEKIKDIKTKKEFDKDIKELQSETDSLIDEDTAALMIIDKLGRNNESIVKIKDLVSKTDCTISGKITRIEKLRNFNRKNGSKGTVINLEISDETGRCGLVLWDKDVELIKNNKIKIGTNVKIINGYIKEGFNGIEINIGRWSHLEILKEGKRDIKIKKPDEKIIKGKLIEKQATRPFFKDNGDFGFVRVIKLQINNDVQRITIWDKKVKEIEKLKIGDKIELKNIDTKTNKGIKELHLNSTGIVKKL